MKRIPLVPIVFTLLASCTEQSSDGERSTTPAPGVSGRSSSATNDHGTRVALGSVTVAGLSFDLARLGEVVPGRECAFEVRLREERAATAPNVYLWVESEDGVPLSAPDKGTREEGAFHFHVTPRAGSEAPFRVVLRVRMEGVDERAGLPLDGHGHEHHDGPHDGVLAGFHAEDVPAGHLELKLHDDLGDLELWLARDRDIEQPFDLPLDGSVEVEFVDVGGRKVTLRPRDRTRNADEQGQPNVRDGKTHYFVYPSREGEDASWLRGADFQSIVVVRFADAGRNYVSEEFVLRPHTHE